MLRAVRNALWLVVLGIVVTPALAAAQADAGLEADASVEVEADASVESGSASETTSAAAVEEDEHVPGVLDDDDHPERGVAHRQHTEPTRAQAALSTAVFPPAQTTVDPDPDPELEEELHAPPPVLEWRLRLGIGASAATAGGAQLSFRLLQELEWMPTEVAPILFSLTGGELIGGYDVFGFGAARVGLYGLFCQDSVVTCTGAIALRGGVIGGSSGVTFDLGGDGDARFRFDGVELGVRVGFFVIQSVTYVDLLGMVGAAF